VSPPRPDVKLIGTWFGEEEQRLRDLFTRVAQPFDWIEADTPEATELLAAHGLSEQDLPVVIEGREDKAEVIPRADVNRITTAWHISTPPSKRDYDLAIVGAGPAGLAAAVYAASDGLSTLVLEEDLPGGQASYTSMIENFFGFPEGIGGAELARRAGRQAERFGAELSIRHAVTGGSRLPNGGFEVLVDGTITARARVAIAAPGMFWRRLEVGGVDELLGHGIYYGAGRSEAAGCMDKDLIIVGGGNSAGQAAMFLSDAGARVKMLVRDGKLAVSMSAYLIRRIEENPQVEVRLGTTVEKLEASEGRLAAVIVQVADGSSEQLKADMMFVCIGGEPRTGWVADAGVRTNESGYVLTGPDLLLKAGRRAEDWPLERDPLALETSAPGLFAAGDARLGSVKRVGGAVGEGAMAGAFAERRLQELDEAES
jgi:thioredoxin reductase (NADPH)